VARFKSFLVNLYGHEYVICISGQLKTIKIKRFLLEFQIIIKVKKLE
jgi:hypothetical protein